MRTEQGSERSVVVGVDGSDGSRVALEWAIDKAHHFGPVRTVTAFRVGPFGDGFGTFAGVEPGIQIYKDAAEYRLRKILDATEPELLSTATIVESHAGAALVQACADADLLVVGCRGRTAVAEILLGSIGSYCVKHSKVPVAVIPAHVPSRRPLKHIAVGVDGSDNSKAALCWAIEHVDPDGTVEAIGCYNPVPYAMDAYVPPIEVLEKQTWNTLEEAVSDASGNAETGPTIKLTVRTGDPRSELRAAGEEADLLVIGARGHRGVGYLLLGSVTTSLLHHPTAATVVVPY